MTNPFFDHPILNSPYERPRRHWELDASGQPTQLIREERRRAEFITPIPKPKKRKAAAQPEMDLGDPRGLSSGSQRYDAQSNINYIRGLVDAWRSLSNPAHWQVSPQTQRLLTRWRHHEYGGQRYLPAVREAEGWEDCCEGDQSSRGRSHESVPRLTAWNSGSPTHSPTAWPG